jgi:peptidyl-prolyl cis-trans isomerase B (cyclophilin B)
MPTREKDYLMAKSYAGYPELVVDKNKNYSATIATDHGDIEIELYVKEAPLTVNNFVFLAQEGFYNGVTFHRVIPGFVAQGGDPTGSGRGGPGYQFDDEVSPRNIPHRHAEGSLSMANAGANTNGSQFFIVYAPQPHLDGKHTIFGKVTSGMDVAKKLKNGDTMRSVTIHTA